jgi:hypothetical protein
MTFKKILLYLQNLYFDKIKGWTCILTNISFRIAECEESGEDSPYCIFARDNFNYAVDEFAMKWRAWEPNR